MRLNAELAIAPNPNKSLWEKGDFTRVAETMRQSGEQLAAELDIQPGMKVLDLGCGDGTTALPAARRGANVVGVDIAANLVAAAFALVLPAATRFAAMSTRRAERGQRPPV